MANTITLSFAGDSKSLERTFDKVGEGAKDMAADIDSAERQSRRLGDSIGGMNDKIGNAESKFSGAADLADGLTSAFGINVGGTIEMARAYADMAGGFSAVVGPALQTLTTKMSGMTAVTKAQTAATTAMNTVMRANPVLLVVTAIAALTAGLIVAYKKSETFRAVVDGAFKAVREGAQWVGDKVAWLGDKVADLATSAGKKLGSLAETITAPYRTAFKAIASIWNNTVGKLSVKIPGFMGFGGVSFDVPDIPTFARGGRFDGGPMIVGEGGPEILFPGVPGTIAPNSAAGSMGGGNTVVQLVLDGRVIASSTLSNLQQMKGRGQRLGLA